VRVRRILVLRSILSCRGFSIGARDGEIGKVHSFLFDDLSWIIHSLVVDTRNWQPGRGVLVSPKWVRAISWEGQEVWVDVFRRMIEDSPPYDPSAPVNREYEVQMYEYYGRPKYWA
jgi:hypothetical protein